ncbi:MAG: hypothetical protein AB7I42_24045 [Bradyrhizobium sp.]|uniref:hypothetical protein n=1 Tax=Bradyrhizobium sp. TaxID=376 RepID=UPI003D09B3B3
MDRIYLSGSEEVGRAGASISSAASEMQRAASSIDSSLEIFMRRFEEQVRILVETVDRLETMTAPKGA